MGKEQFFWLFSTIAQTYGALIAVIGMLVVFRFQNISSYISTVHQKHLVIRRGYFGDKAYSQSPDKFIEDWAERKDDKPDSDEIILEKLCEDLSAHYNQRSELRKRFLIFFFGHMLILVLSITAIMFDWELLNWFSSLQLKLSVGVILAANFCFSVYFAFALIGGGKVGGGWLRKGCNYLKGKFKELRKGD